MKTVTVREFIEAVRKNGFKQITGNLFQSRYPQNHIDEGNYPPPNTKIIGACAYGQALINLGIDKPVDLSYGSIQGRIYSGIWRLNDGFYGPIYNLQEIADKLENEFKDELDEILEFEEFDYTPYLEEVKS